jgi:hypothetical protein
MDFIVVNVNSIEKFLFDLTFLTLRDIDAFLNKILNFHSTLVGLFDGNIFHIIDV